MSLDLQRLREKLDRQLESETRESLIEWMKKKRNLGAGPDRRFQLRPPLQPKHYHRRPNL
jgi:hypothetical protein